MRRVVLESDPSVGITIPDAGGPRTIRVSEIACIAKSEVDKGTYIYMRMGSNFLVYQPYEEIEKLIVTGA